MRMPAATRTQGASAANKAPLARVPAHARPQCSQPSVAAHASASDRPLAQRACGAILAAAEITPVYFGNGCFWGRQKDYIDTEMQMGRDVGGATAVVGYAGGQENGKSTCYYYNAPDVQYERQGHAEVVQVGLDSATAKDQMAMFAKTYFSQFKKTPMGMIRLDPQDRGAGYRNVVGIPGGMDSELYKVFAAQNANKMKLVPGEGNTMTSGKATENDAVNTVYIVDAEKLPFHQAEVYHQFHNGMGKSFPQEYLVDMKKAKIRDGTLRNQQGCMEYPF